jgi:16S rRNA (guanine527-N7)-methyltransferase
MPARSPQRRAPRGKPAGKRSTDSRSKRPKNRRAPPRPPAPSWDDEPRAARLGSAGATLATQPWEVLKPLLADDGRSGERIELLKRFCARVLEWNRGASNLISRNDESRIVERHVRESLAPARWLSVLEARHWLDLGSGAGFPAIPLCIWGLGVRWTLVESRRPKALFLRKVVEELALDGQIEVHHARLEDLVGILPTVDALTSRATYRIAPTLLLANEFLVPGGAAVLWKGRSWKAELHDFPGWQEHWDLEGHEGLGPGLGEVVYFKKR